MSTLLLKHADLLVTMDAERRRIADGGLFIRDNAIVQAGPTAELPETADTVIDARGMIVLPGLVNTHHHLYQTLTRCIAQDSVLFDWLVTLYPIWARLTPRGGLRLRQGRPGRADAERLHDLQRSPVRLSQRLQDRPRDRGRGRAGHPLSPPRGGSMSLGRSRGGLPPDSCVEDEAYILKDSQRAIEQYHRRERFGMVHVGAGAVLAVQRHRRPDGESAKLARAYGVRLHTHLAETMDEDAFCLQKFGAKPVDYVASLGWTGDDVWHAHCVCLNQAEIALFARTGSGVAHCPSSNMRLASGIAPVRAMRDAGVKVGLGVDGSASNDGNHMLGEARQAMLLQRMGSARQPPAGCWRGGGAGDRHPGRRSGARPRRHRQRWPPAWPPTSSATGWSGSTSPARCTIRWPRWSSARRRRWI